MARTDPEPPPVVQPPPASAVAVGTHRPRLTSQAASGAQSPLEAQASPHRPSVRQRYGAQGVTVPSTAVDVERSSLHVPPAGLHAPAEHSKPSAQSALLAQRSLHAPATQRKGLHDAVGVDEHAPAPSHTSAGESSAPTHAAGRQTVVGPWRG